MNAVPGLSAASLARDFPTRHGDAFTESEGLTPEGVRQLLAGAMADPSLVFAYACAVGEPGAPPVDEIVYGETGGGTLGVVWVRHPGSFTGTTGHLLGGTEDHGPDLLLRWAGMVFELAYQVEHRVPCPFRAAPAPARSDQASSGRAQAADLRWRAAYALNLYFRRDVGDVIRDEYGAVEPQQDLGELTADEIARIARRHGVIGPAALIPPGWDLIGWDYGQERAHPILAGLQPRDGRADETDSSR
ncbi:hypothetical protein ACQPZP_05295 [Spirillospora sp. CA-142024]|uniref:hypothetical protein n=1 Tax=Spirillospora sp. CA-142024 TaxID=3240036 RepID=UPI003D916299